MRKTIKRLLAKAVCAFIPNKSWRTQIRQMIEHSRTIIALDAVDSCIPRNMRNSLNLFSNEDFLALNFAHTQNLPITQENLKISNASKFSKPYFVESNKAYNLNSLINGGGGKISLIQILVCGISDSLALMKTPKIPNLR